MILTSINRNLNRIATALEIIAKIPTISVSKTENLNMEFASPNIEEFEENEKHEAEIIMAQAIKERNGEEQFFPEDVVPIELLTN